jgi:hypothetical protein
MVTKITVGLAIMSLEIHRRELDWCPSGEYLKWRVELWRTSWTGETGEDEGVDAWLTTSL